MCINLIPSVFLSSPDEGILLARSIMCVHGDGNEILGTMGLYIMVLMQETFHINFYDQFSKLPTTFTH